MVIFIFPVMESSALTITHARAVNDLHFQECVCYLFMCTTCARYNFDLDLSEDFKCASQGKTGTQRRTFLRRLLFLRTGLSVITTNSTAVTESVTFRGSTCNWDLNDRTAIPYRAVAPRPSHVSKNYIRVLILYTCSLHYTHARYLFIIIRNYYFLVTTKIYK